MSTTPQSPPKDTEEPEDAGLTGFVRGGWAGWQSPGRRVGQMRWVSLVLAERWPSEALNRRERSVAYRVRREVHRSVVDEVYVKHTSEPLLRGLLRLEWPQSWRVARLEAKMRSAGLAVPGVWLAASRVGWRGLEHVVVLAGVPGESLREMRQTLGRGGAYDDALRTAARAVTRLHDAGFVHGDLVPGNLLLPPEASDGQGGASPVVFIDNDRTRRVVGPWRLRARCRNAAQLSYRLRLLGRWADARTFLRAYAAASDLPAWQVRSVRMAAVRRSRRSFKLAKARGLRAEMDGGPVYDGP
ncbi:MAG: lipopolysaccharide kinase InaA family protein [Planctomycetota bacterium]